MTRSRVLIAAALTAVTACASMRFDTTWKNSDAKPVPITGKKVLVVALNVPAVIRQGIETAMADELHRDGAFGVPSFKVLDPQTTAAAAKSKMQAEGYDAAFIVRLADNEQDIVTTKGYTPGTQLQSLSGGAWSTADAMEFTANKKVWVEALVYSVRDDQLAWSGVTSMDNVNIGAACRDIARMAVVEMKRIGMLV